MRQVNPQFFLRLLVAMDFVQILFTLNKCVKAAGLSVNKSTSITPNIMKYLNPCV